VQRTWDLVLQKYASLGEYEKLLQLLEELKDLGVTASASTYSELLKQVSESGTAVKMPDDLNDTVPAI
jgi:pentatricopeptide repeat protein